MQPVLTPPALSHLVIFNPTLATLKSSPKPEQDDTRDKDLEDDLKEAAQILFYNSREAGGVSRDKMLRQVGLVKGLMGFTAMVIQGEEKKDWWSVHAQKSRLIVYTPEPDFHIYLNVDLSRVPILASNGTRAEPSATAQGLSDEVLVRALSRGYEDFRLLHGSFTNLLPPSSGLSTLLEKFWTRFAFSLEAQYLTPHPSPDILASSLGGYPPPISHTQEAISRALEDLDIQGEAGVIVKEGPISPGYDFPLTRYLVNLLQSSLSPAPDTPKLDTRHTLGFGLGRKRSAESRKTNWASFGGSVGWVPGLGTGRTSSPTPSPKKAIRKAEEEKEGRGRWSLHGLGLGLGDLGDAMGSALGLAGARAEAGQAGVGSSSPATPAPESDLESSNAPDIQALRIATPRTSRDSSVQVEQTRVDIPDLQAAVQGDEEVDLGWEGRSIWLEREGDLEKRRISWVIRDNILLYIIHSPEAKMPYPLPSLRSILSFYSRISPILIPERPSIELSRPSTPITTPNPSIYRDFKLASTESTGEIDPASANSLAELRDTLQTDESMNEIFARTAASQFIVGKRSKGEEGAKGWNELYMLVGRKDASLTDAEHAVRGFSRSHPELV